MANTRADLQDFHKLTLENSSDSPWRPLENADHKGGARFLMFNALLRHPRDVGTVCPSSQYLAARMAASIDANEQGYIVELGGGTGIITEALLRRGVSADKLIVVEKSLPLARYLTSQFPGICVMHGDAADIPASLQRAKSVSAVISGLPLRSLPTMIVNQIAGGWTNTLTRTGRVVQFTYAPFRCSAWLQAGLERTASEIVWANFPPARVEIFNAL